MILRFVFFITGFKKFDYCVLWCSFIHVYCAWGSLSFLDLWVYSFHQFWKILSYYFFKLFFFLAHFSLFSFRWANDFTQKINKCSEEMRHRWGNTVDLRYTLAEEMEGEMIKVRRGMCWMKSQKFLVQLVPKLTVWL